MSSLSRPSGLNKSSTQHLCVIGLITYIDKFYFVGCFEWLTCFEFKLLIKLFCYSLFAQVNSVFSSLEDGLPEIVLVNACALNVAV